MMSPFLLDRMYRNLCSDSGPADLSGCTLLIFGDLLWFICPSYHNRLNFTGREEEAATVSQSYLLFSKFKNRYISGFFNMGFASCRLYNKPETQTGSNESRFSDNRRLRERRRCFCICPGENGMISGMVWSLRAAGSMRFMRSMTRFRCLSGKTVSCPWRTPWRPWEIKIAYLTRTSRNQHFAILRKISLLSI